MVPLRIQAASTFSGKSDTRVPSVAAFLHDTTALEANNYAYSTAYWSTPDDLWSTERDLSFNSRLPHCSNCTLHLTHRTMKPSGASHVPRRPDTRSYNFSCIADPKSKEQSQVRGPTYTAEAVNVQVEPGQRWLGLAPCPLAQND